MLLMNKPISLILIASFVFVSSAYSQAPINVYDPTVHGTMMKNHTQLYDGVTASGKAIVQAINNQSDQLTSVLQAINDYDSLDRQLIFAHEQKRANAERYSKSEGSKAKLSCGTFKRASTLVNGISVIDKIEKFSNELTEAHFESEKGNAPNELTLATTASKLINTISVIRDLDEESGDPKSKIDDGEFISSLNRSLSTERLSNGHSRYLLEVRKNGLLIDPFPARLPENYDYANQPTSEAIRNAQAVIKQEKLKVSSEIINYMTASQAAVVSKDWLDYFFSVDPSIGKPMKERYFGSSEFMGRNASMEALNNMRLYDPDWIGRLASSSDNTVSMMKDQNLMSAQSLVNEQDTITLIRAQTKLLALIYAELVQANTQDLPPLSN